MSGMSRRNVLSLAAAGAATVAADSLFGVSPVAAFDHHHKKAGFELPPLPYAYDALQKSIDEQTMHIHHDKHHQGYVNKLNAAVEGMPELQKHSVEDLLRNIDQVPKKIRQDVINNGGGHANHTLFWEVMGPNGGGEPTGKLGQAIKKQFKSFSNFRDEFASNAGSVFGSGWGWLIVDDGKLKIVKTSNQDSPLLKGKTPLLGVDVWEHAYYLKYQNRRPDYIQAWFNVVNWENVGKRYEQA